MFSVTSLGFLPFMALFVCLWYHVPQPSRWKLVLAANAVFCLSIDIGAFFAVAPCHGSGVAGRAACAARAAQPPRVAGTGAGRSPAAAAGAQIQRHAGAGLRDLYKPFGLAYYSLQLAGYMLDVWHGRTAPTPSYARLWCYAGFFLSLTQGPFNRYNTLMPQLEAAPKTFETQRLISGLQRSAWGYFKKFAIADRAAIVVSAAFADPASFDRSQLIFATVMYSFQLYADFSGYTDIVLGMGEILGLHLPENFRQPFFSASVKELWARWHISLSQWFRDYVYIPLGGNRKAARRDGQPAADLFGQRAVARRQLDLPCLGWAARPVPGGGGPHARSAAQAQISAAAHRGRAADICHLCYNLYNLPHQQFGQCGGILCRYPA